MAAQVHGIAITSENVMGARQHPAANPGISSQFEYEVVSAEELVTRGEQYDVVLASEPEDQPAASQQTASSRRPGPPPWQPAAQAHAASQDQPASQKKPRTHTPQPHSHRKTSQQPARPGSQQTSQNAADSQPRHAEKPAEVIEHVLQPDQFVATIASLAKAATPEGDGTASSKGGMVVVSTLNRTVKSFAVAIAAAEYVTGIVPRGTHDWNKFITPEELYMMADDAGLSMAQAAGIALGFPPGSQIMTLSDDLGVNYIAAFSKSPPTIVICLDFLDVTKVGI
eukprot:gene7502-648_t